jgi:retron-type reverse transcriptase
MNMARNPFQQLDVIRNASQKGQIITDCYRLMYKKELWIHAYNKLYKNVSGSLSLCEIENIIEQLKAGTFRFVRMNRNEKQLMLIDKLVQEVMRMIIESIYEPIFHDTSHGFREGRGYYTALTTIVHSWSRLTWCIGGRISNLFKQIDYSLLLHLLASKIKDKRFLLLVHRVLNYVIIEEALHTNSFSGTGNKKSLALLLINIYLHELDLWIEKIKDKHKSEASLRLQGYQGKRNISAGYLPRGIEYIRYADHFIVGVVGSKQYAWEIKEKMKHFLRNNLHIDFKENDMSVHHLEQSVSFLGYAFKREKQCYNENTQNNIQTCTIRLEIPKKKINEYARKHQYGDLNSFTPTHRTKLINCSELKILHTYNTELCKIAHYYKLATNYHHLERLFYLAEGSFIKTIASKRRSTAKKVALSMRIHRQGRLCLIGEDNRLYSFVRLKDVKYLE